MSAFPKGLRVLVVDDPTGTAQMQLLNAELGYHVTAVHSLEAAQACFAGGAATYDCVLLEHVFLADAGRTASEAFFRLAAQTQAPVVLMAASPSQGAVLEGIRLGAAAFLERPLSFQSLRTLWQHKIRKMMASANGGQIPRHPSCPQLGGPSDSTGTSSGCPPLARCTSVPASPCPATPSLQPWTFFAQDSLSSDSGLQGLGVPAAAAGGTEQSDATSGAPRSSPAPPPLACLHLGDTSAPVWPMLPLGSAWGTPVGCGVPPPLLRGRAPREPPVVPAASLPEPEQELTVRRCPPGSLPAPASSNALLLPEDFSLAPPLCLNGACHGPLGLRLTVTPELLSSINDALRSSQPDPACPPSL